MPARGGIGFASAVLAAALVWPASSFGGSAPAIRYAEPNGNGPEPCAEADPCGIFLAVESAPNGAQVHLLAGDYALGAEQVLDVPIGVGVHGLGDAADTTLSSSAQIAVYLSGQSALTDVRINGNNNRALMVFGSSAARRVYVQNSNDGDGSWACVGNYDANIIDSVCRGTGNSTGGVANLAQGFSSPLILRGVTAYSEGGVGVLAESLGSGTTATVNARNTIASGLTYDAAAVADLDSSAAIDFDFSNFDSVSMSGAGARSVTPPGSLDNQTAEPIFVDAVNGNFREAPNSPTVDAGSPTAVSDGDTDLDRNPRTVGEAPDIGAYESQYVDTTGPETQIKKGPKKRTTKRKATFRFAGNDDVTDPSALEFECALDNANFESCTSPKTYKRLKPGRHTFFVRATDAAQNTGESAKYAWKVKD